MTVMAVWSQTKRIRE